MADILITGATGLLGQRVLACLSKDHDVVAIARRPPDSPQNARWITHDLRQPALPPDLPGRIDVVIHLAQDREFRSFPTTALDTFNINVASTALLLAWAQASGARQVILTSTGGVYRRGAAAHHEDEPVGGPEALAFYPASKLAAEHLAQAYCCELMVTILRPFFIYGRGQDDRMLLPRLVNSIRSGQAIPVDGQDGMRFNPIHASDAALAVKAALTLEDSCIVNVGGPEILTLRQAVDTLAFELGTEARFECRDVAEPTNVIGDISRMVRLLHRPGLRLVDAVSDLCG